MKRLSAIVLLTVVAAVFAIDKNSPPNTFVAGTAAKASEVNANFDSLDNKVDEIIDTLDAAFVRFTDFSSGDSTFSRVNADTIGGNPYIDSATGPYLYFDVIVGVDIDADTLGSYPYIDSAKGPYVDFDLILGDSLALSTGATAATMNTGQGDYELYAMDQDVQSTDTVSFDTAYVSRLGAGTLTAETVNTGNGANEVYAMDQDVQTTDDVVFDSTFARVAKVDSLTFDGSTYYTASAVIPTALELNTAYDLGTIKRDSCSYFQFEVLGANFGDFCLVNIEATEPLKNGVHVTQGNCFVDDSVGFLVCADNVVGGTDTTKWALGSTTINIKVISQE